MLPGVRGQMNRRKAAKVMHRIVETPQKPGEAEEVALELTGKVTPSLRLTAEQVFEAWQVLPLRSRRAVAQRMATHLDEQTLSDDLPPQT